MQWKSNKAARHSRRIRKIMDLESWHPWFAWRPVRLECDSKWVWWEHIERKKWHGVIGSIAQYRRGPKEDPTYVP